MLVTDAGEEMLRAAAARASRRAIRMATTPQNRSDRDALLLEMGSRRPNTDATTYPGIDLRIKPGGGYLHRDGRPYPD